MRRNLVSPLGLFAAHAAASLVNIRFLFHGRTTPVQWLCFAVTLLYIGYWLLYSRKVPNAGIAAYTVLFFVFMAGFAVVLLLMGPFAGLEAVFPAPWLWIAGALVSTAVVLFSLRVKHRR